ncbi:MAG: zinc-ribbon domain-containing protein [Candidatus Stygibacter frigidus]|nr:zinc-ribbon domain-containing protein [Candidatus Stygibacter frigidus]
MPFCKRCGKEIAANLKVCPQCGAKINYKSNEEDDVYGEDFDLDADLELEDLDDEDDEYDDEEDDEDENDYYDDFIDLEDEDEN